MDSDLRFMFDLIGAAVFGKKSPAQPKDADWQKIYLLSKKHNISNIICYGILKGNYEIPQSYLGMFKQDMFANLIISENQNKETSKIFEEFEKNGIDFMPLKGSVIKNIYPSPDMRRMGDADILIKKEQYAKADNAMKSLGYDFIQESDHEYIYHKEPVMHIELHKYLMPTYNDDLYSYYGNGWDIAQKKQDSSCEYELKSDDNFVYLVTHLAKHYRDGGTGIKSFIDIELYMQKFNPDMNYADEQFEKLGIKEFTVNLFNLLSFWFEDGKENTIIKNMTGYVLNSGEYGTKKNREGVVAIRDFDDSKDFKEVRKKKILNSALPSSDVMKQIFPSLKKVPWLLPVFWIYRWIRCVFRPESRASFKKINSSVSVDSMKAYADHMKEVGIDIYNGRK